MIRSFVILLFMLLPVMRISAQTNNKAAEQLMSKRVITYDDASYNVALLIPKLNEEHKKDTIDILVDYYVRNFGMTDPVACYVIIRDIRNHSFKESIRPWLATDTTKKLSDSVYYQRYILSYYFQWYLDNNNIGTDGAYREDLRDAYGRYFSFIKKLAKETLDEPGLTPAEKFILRFYMSPSDSMYRLLDGLEFAGTSLQKAWFSATRERYFKSGVDLAAFAGVWIPNGNLSVLGSHPYVGCSIGAKKRRNSYSMRVDFRFVDAPQDYRVRVDTGIYTTNSFFGLNMGLDYGYQLAGKKRTQLDVVGGVAWEFFDSGFSAQYASDNRNSTQGSFNTVNLNMGLSYKLFVKHKIKKSEEKDSYLALVGKYNLLFFNNRGGTDITGNAITIGLSYGAHYRKVQHYYISN